MTNDEILYAVCLIKRLEDVSAVMTIDINGQWLPIIGVEKKNGERFWLEGFSQIFSYIKNNIIQGGDKH